MKDSARPALDAQAIDRLRRWGDEAGEDLVAQLVKLFLPDADSLVNSLRRALAADDVVEVSRSAHTLCGASANIGAAELARACASLERASSCGDPGGLRPLLEAVEAELARVRAALGLLLTS
jgi:two-component system, sensor histidine kinase and response regulator